MTKKTMSLKDRIRKAAENTGRHPYTVEDWGGETVYVHEMSVADAQDFIGVAKELEEGGDDAAAGNLEKTVDMLMRAVRDEDGARLFEGDDDREWLMSQPIRTISEIAKALIDHSGMGDAENEAAKNG